MSVCVCSYVATGCAMYTCVCVYMCVCAYESEFVCFAYMSM